MRRSTGIISTCIALALAAAPAVAQQGNGPQKPQQQGVRAKPAAAKGAVKTQAPERGNAAAKAQQQKPKDPPRQQARPQPRGGDNQGQGNAQRGQGSVRGQGGAARGGDAVRGSANGRGNGAGMRAANPRGNRAARMQARAALARMPDDFRALERSDRRSDRFVLGAAALGSARALDLNALDLRRANDRLEVRNRRGDILFEMDEDRARSLGSWDLRLLGDREPRENAPAFCRSGAGHPVWGREWCLDKGFGLGRSNDRLWSRTGDVGDIIWRRTTDRDRLDRPGIIDVLGDVVFGRLALHALSLGFADPLVGRWVAEPDGPRLLLIDSGTEPVAEFVDLDRDDEVDVLYVSHYGY